MNTLLTAFEHANTIAHSLAQAQWDKDSPMVWGTVGVQRLSEFFARNQSNAQLCNAVVERQVKNVCQVIRQSTVKPNPGEGNYEKRKMLLCQLQYDLIPSQFVLACQQQMDLLQS